jgi:4-carboxymuconolactone decarboxylase
MSRTKPRNYDEFTKRFPKLGQAWEMLSAGALEAGPLDEKTLRLVKLGIAVGSMQEGAVHSAVRRARNAGIPAEAIEQVIASSASTIGLPRAAAAWTWVRDVIESAE